MGNYQKLQKNIFSFNNYRANQIIRERSDQTALSFIYLAAPPKLDTPDFNERSVRYMELLTELTAELPPTILVHGVSTVTSTTL